MTVRREDAAMKTYRLAPAILPADVARLGEDVARVIADGAEAGRRAA